MAQRALRVRGRRLWRRCPAVGAAAAAMGGARRMRRQRQPRAPRRTGATATRAVRTQCSPTRAPTRRSPAWCCVRARQSGVAQEAVRLPCPLARWRARASSQRLPSMHLLTRTCSLAHARDGALALSLFLSHSHLRSHVGTRAPHALRHTGAVGARRVGSIWQRHYLRALVGAPRACVRRTRRWPAARRSWRSAKRHPL